MKPSASTRNLAHGLLLDANLAGDDYRPSRVVVEVRLVPKLWRHRLSRVGSTGYATMWPGDYCKAFGVFGWDGDSSPPSLTDVIH